MVMGLPIVRQFRVVSLWSLSWQEKGSMATLHTRLSCGDGRRSSCRGKIKSCCSRPRGVSAGSSRVACDWAVIREKGLSVMVMKADIGGRGVG